MKLSIYRVRFPLDKHNFKSVEMAQFDISNNMHFWGSCFTPCIFLPSQNRLIFLEKKSSGNRYLLLPTLWCRGLPCLPNNDETWDNACRQGWLAAWFIDCLFLICVAYFKSLADGI